MNGNMNNQIISNVPTIYADMNVFRYVAYGELEILNPENFRWVYSHVHLDEIRGGNTDVLDGMSQLKAVEICDVLNVRFESVGNIVLRNYVDPNDRYQQHLEAISGYENSDELMVEHLLRIFGADNFAELSLTPEKLRIEIDRLTSCLPDEIRNDLVKRVEDVSVEMQESINVHLKERRPVDQTRLTMGLTSSARDEAQKSASAIDALWNIIGSSMGGVSKDQFFGFEQNPAIKGIPHTQHGALSGAHIVLNLLGFSPDKGLAKREKIKNIMSDGQHVGLASYCNGLLSADKRFCDKANAIYNYIGSRTKALWFQYKPEGCVIQLGVEEA